MPEAKRPSKKTIRRKLKKKRTQVGGLQLVTPNAPLAWIVGPEPRPRKEIVQYLHAYAEERGLVDSAKSVVHADPTLVDLFWGRNRVRQSDLVRVVTYNVLPGAPVMAMSGSLSGNRRVAMAGPLPGKRRVLVRPPKGSEIYKKEKEEKEKNKEKEEEKSFVR